MKKKPSVPDGTEGSGRTVTVRRSRNRSSQEGSGQRKVSLTSPPIPRGDRGDAVKKKRVKSSPGLVDSRKNGSAAEGRRGVSRAGEGNGPDPKLKKSAGASKSSKARKRSSGPSREETGQKRRPSRSKKAIQARKRRAEARGVADQLRFERWEGAAKKRRALRLRVARVKNQDPSRWDLMSESMDWMEDIRNRIASLFPCSLRLADPVTGEAPTPPEEEAGDLEVHANAERQRENIRTPWLIVGRFDPVVPISYDDLGDAFYLVERDLIIEATINPARLSQIRIVYSDPRSRRGEGDSIVSQMGAWEYVISTIRQDLIGAVPDDEDALARRYSETKVSTFYIYFSDQLRSIKSAWFTTWGVE